MGQFHFDPSTYRELMVSEIPEYDRLQDAVRDAAAGVEPVERILDLGTGTGVTADRVLGLYPRAQVAGIDESAGMLAHARTVLPAATVLRTADLRDSLPEGPFDLVVSALAVHPSTARVRPTCLHGSRSGCVRVGDSSWVTLWCQLIRPMS